MEDADLKTFHVLGPKFRNGFKVGVIRQYFIFFFRLGGGACIE